MNFPSIPRPLRPLRVRRAIVVVAALILAGITWVIWTSLRTTDGPRAPAAVRSRSRDVSADSPYLNTRPGVAYVGDEACARCHGEIAEDYRRHPMGRSLEAVAAADVLPPIGGIAGLPFEAKGVRYTVERRDGRMIHKASRRRSDGSPFAEVEAEIRYALGSGTRGITYLIERDGFLFQSPIAWFAQKKRWDISPGYGEFGARPNFERPITPECLTCHANQFRPVAGTLNRYEAPIFRGHAIGCERCHGPGALHVKAARPSAGPDLTIVNPSNLAPVLRESVCQQCHLQGSYRFTRGEHGPLDFRPGLPLHPFVAVFLMKKGDQGKFEAVGQVEQMESSRCFRASDGQLGCISCHDPHRLPAIGREAEYYSGRCLTCHETKDCTVPEARRRPKGSGEDCIACHMPVLATTNIPHTAATDHRIPRGTPGSVREGARVASGQPADVPLMEYQWGLMTPAEQQEAGRDLGVALSLASRLMNAAPALAKAAAAQAVPRLEAAVRDRPDDLRARDALGQALGILGRGEEALGAFREVLRVAPDRELTLRSAGRALARLQRPDPARAMLQRAVAVDPWRSDYRLALARACAQAGDWPAAVAACREAIRLDPELFEARSLLVQGYLRSGEPAKADAEFRTLLLFSPASREVWEQWYERQKQAGPGGLGPASDGNP